MKYFGPILAIAWGATIAVLLATNPLTFIVAGAFIGWGCGAVKNHRDNYKAHVAWWNSRGQRGRYTKTT